MSITDRLETLIPKDGTFVSINAGSPNEQIVRDAIAHIGAKPVSSNSTEKLTGLAYLLEHAEFADKEAREKTEARIKPVVDAIISGGDDQAIDAVFFALNGAINWRVSLGMEKGE